MGTFVGYSELRSQIAGQLMSELTVQVITREHGRGVRVGNCSICSWSNA